MKRYLLNKPYIYKVSLWLAHILPLPIMKWITNKFAYLTYFLYEEARSNVEDNLSHIFADPVMIKNSAKEVFINYGLYLADWAKLIAIDSKEVLSRFSVIEGNETFREAHKKGKGIILLAAHLGNWELGGLFFGSSGLPINIITARDEVNEIANSRAAVRVLHNVKTITIDDAPFFFIDIVNALRRNEIVAMLIDRYERKNGVLIDFFGKPAYFPPGPVLLARSTGCAVLPAFTVMEGNGSYKTAVGSSIEMEFSDDKDKDVYVNLKKIVSIFEQYIRKYPNQWYNFSPVWNKE
jgi:KDO2-lipid IV(A) lauroyltransferase